MTQKVILLSFILFLCLLAFSIGAYVSRAKIEYEKDQVVNPVTQYLRENYGVDSIEEYIAKLEQEIRASYTFQNEENQTDLQPKLQEKLSSGTAAYADLNSILQYLDDYTSTTWQNISKGGTETYQPTYLKSEAKPQYVNFSFYPLTELAAFSFFGTAFTALLMIPKTGKKLLKRERLVWLIILIAAVGIAFSLGQVYSQTQPPNRYFDAYELPYSYMISTDGTYYYATRYDGYLAFGGPTNRGGVNGTDALAVFQAAIDSLSDKGGTIFIKSGRYLIRNTISLSSGIILRGESCYHFSSPKVGTELKLADGANVVLLNAKGEQNGLTYDIILDSLIFNGNREYQTQEVDLVDLSNARKVFIYNCHFQNAARDALKVNWAWVENCFFGNNGRRNAWLATDVYFISNNVAGGVHNSAYAGDASVDLGAGANLVIGNDIYLCANGHGLTCYGSVENIIMGNRISHNNRCGIYLNAGANRNIIIGNKVHDNSQYAQGVFDGILVKDSMYNVVKGNECWNKESSNRQNYGIRETGTANYNLIIGNIVSGNYNPNGISIVGSNTILKGNIGCVTENSGTTTIPAGSTYVTVTHGLAITPDINRIKVTPKDNLGGRSFWVSDVTSTTFRINISSSDTVDHTFGWSYD